MKKAIVIVLVAAMLLHFLPPGFQRASADVVSPVDPLQGILLEELEKLTTAMQLNSPAGFQQTDTDIVSPVDPLRDILRGEKEAAKPKANAEATASISECKLDEFSSAEDEALLELIESVSLSCIYNSFFDNRPFSLFGHIPDSRIDVFSEKNMIYIAVSARDRVDEYDSTQGRTGLVAKLYVFLQAGYWNYASYPSHFNHVNKHQIQLEIASALQAFIENGYFYAEGEGDRHASVLETIVGLTALSDLGSVFFFEFAKLLRNRSITRAYIQSDREWILMLAILVLLEKNQQRIVSTYSDDDSSSFESSLIGLAEALVDIGVSDSRVSTDSETFRRLAYILRSILYDFSNDRPALLSAVKTNLRRLVNYWEERDAFSANYYISIGIAVYLYRRNHTYLTDLVEEFLKKIFPAKYSCGRHIIRSQEEDQKHREEVCETLAYQEELFHSVLDTDRRPVLNLHDIEVLIFENTANYFAVGNFIFGYGASRSSGIYAGQSGEYGIGRAVVGRSESFSTLRHEFVHYLDHRYNGGGGYFWTEGIAIYLSLENNFPVAIGATRTDRVSLSSILDVSYEGTNHRYHYSATRFLFERHPEDVAEFLDIFYKRDRYSTEYIDYVRNSIGTSYDSEFASWLETATANDDPLPRITRKPRPPTGGGTDEPGGGPEEPGGGPENPEEFPSEITLSTDDEREMVFDLSEFNISEGLSDPVYSAVSSDPSIAEVTLNGRVLTITIKRPGQVQITVRVGNRGEDPTEYTLQLTIDDGECPRHICRNFYSGWRLYLLQQLESRTETEEESQNNPSRL